MTSSGYATRSDTFEEAFARLSTFWAERARDYEVALPHFSSYYLRRFRRDTLKIATLLPELGLITPCSTIVDVGAGLAPWSLPFILSSRKCVIHAFDTEPTIALAFAEAMRGGLLPEQFQFHFEDYTATTCIPAGSVGTIVCCDALNYIPVLPFIHKSCELCHVGAALLLMVQTDTYNYCEYIESLIGRNIVRATKLGMSTLCQSLVRSGFPLFRPRRTTYSISELGALFELGGFRVQLEFLPAFEKHAGGRLQGLVLRFGGDAEVSSLSPTERLTIRKHICAAGFSDYDDERFAQYTGDILQDRELLLLKTRARGSSLRVMTASREVAIADAVRSGSVVDMRRAIIGVQVEWPHLLAAVMTAIQAGDIPTAQVFFAQA